MRFIQRFFQKLLFVLPVILALVLVVFLLRSRSAPVKKKTEERGRPMRVIAAPQLTFLPKALGYGIADPSHVWQALAEVKGTVASVHSRLESGALISEGTILLQIDPADYELAVALRRAQQAETQAQLDELAVEERSNKASLAIEKRSLDFASKSMQRLRTLRQQEAIAADEVDREERRVLQQEQVLQQIENALAQVPTRREALRAAMAVNAANLQQAELDLRRTVIRAPFACRLGSVKLKKGQVVNAGQKLFEAHGTATVEIEAKFRPEQIRDLLPIEKRQQFQQGLSMEMLQQLFDLTVTIRLHSGAWEASWPARFDRIRETVDLRTRAIKVVAVVEDPYGQVIPGVRPTLVRGMYCEMELQAPARPQTVVLPRGAVVNEMVYLLDDESRLRRQQVQVACTQGDLV
ncbi:MAG: HlyD family efflux transporter periplasmic adaptor subunit, partial [Lentisphaeria bacterium]